MKYNIIIFGTGSCCENLMSYLGNNINIIAYSDNDSSKIGLNYYNIEVIDPEKISSYNYDYIIIASGSEYEILEQLIKMGISEEKIFLFNTYFNLVKEELIFDNMIENCNTHISEFNCFATGISYAYCGINSEVCKDKLCKLCLPSQDLFYDYKLAQYFIKNNKVKNKYCILGLCYYSFEYDLSLSKQKYCVNRYTKLIDDIHNYKYVDIVAYNKKMKIKDCLNNEQIKEYWIKYLQHLKIDSISNLSSNDKRGKELAKIDFNKKYPKTKQENKAILQEYLKLLQKNDINPIIVVFPASTYYTKYFSKKIEEEFRENIDELLKQYRFKYLDYFRSNLFDDYDFCDVSHLNEKGSIKMMNILNDIII